MATLVEATSGPESLPSGPITDEEAAAMARASLSLLRLWGVTDEQAAVLLGLPQRTFARWKAGEPGRIGRPMDVPQVEGSDRLPHALASKRPARLFRPPRLYATCSA